MHTELSAVVNGYLVDVRTITDGDLLSCYLVWIVPEDEPNPEKCAAIRILPHECSIPAIWGALDVSLPGFPEEKRPDVFWKAVEFLLRLMKIVQ